MPAIANQISQVAGPVDSAGTAADTYASVGSTVTLAAGRWLIVGVCSHQNQLGSGGVLVSSDLELRWNSTRLGTSVWCNTFGSFVVDGSSGSALRGFWIIDAAASDTVSIWLRRRNSGGGAASENHRATGAVVEVIELDPARENLDYWIARATNSDAAEVSLSGATWTPSSAAARIGQGVGEVPFNVPSTEDYIILARAETYQTATSATTERSGARLRRVDGTPATLGSGEQYHTHQNGVPTTFVGNPTEVDVRSFTSGEQPEIQWEFNNDAAGTLCAARRSSIIILRSGAFAQFSYIVNAGDGQISSGGGTTEATNGLTFNFGTAAVCWILGSCNNQHGGGNWTRMWLHQDAGDVHWPALGRDDVYFDERVDAAADTMSMLFTTIITQTGSVTWRYAKSSDSGANASTFGRTRGNGGSARTVLLAIELATPATGITVSPAATQLRCVTPTPTISAALSVAAPLSRNRWNTAAAAVVVGALSVAAPLSRDRWVTLTAAVQAGAVSVSPAATRERWVTPTPSLTLTASVVAAASEFRWTTPTVSTIIGAVVSSPGAVRNRWVTPTASVDVPTLDPIVVDAPLLRLRWTTLVVTIATGAVVVTPVLQRIRWRTGTARVEGEIVQVRDLQFGVNTESMYRLAVAGPMFTVRIGENT